MARKLIVMPDDSIEPILTAIGGAVKSLRHSGVPNGERIAEVASRANCVIRRALQADGDVALFGHGHILRILAGCWLELPPESARLFALDTAGIGVLGYERDVRVISHWNIKGACE